MYHNAILALVHFSNWSCCSTSLNSQSIYIERWQKNWANHKNTAVKKHCTTVTTWMASLIISIDRQSLSQDRTSPWIIFGCNGVLDWNSVYYHLDHLSSSKLTLASPEWFPISTLKWEAISQVKGLDINVNVNFDSTYDQGPSWEG